MNLIKSTCLILLVLIVRKVNSFDKKLLCDCKSIDYDDGNEDEKLRTNFVNYIVSLGRLTWNFDLFTCEFKNFSKLIDNFH